MSISHLDAAALRDFLLSGCNRLGERQEEVNAMNVFPVPDGDTGVNMYLTVSSAGKKIDGRDGSEGVGKLCADFAQGALMGARGNSGVILSQIFRGFAASLAGKDTADPRDIAAAMQRGVDLSYKSVMKPVEGTILTVYRYFAAAAEQAAEQGADMLAMFDAAQRAGEDALLHTPDYLPVLKEAGVVDAGGKGLLVFMEGGRESLSAPGEQRLAAVQAAPEQSPALTGAARDDISTADIEFTYCTQLLIKGAGLPVDKIRERLSHTPPGDSLLVVGDEQVIKIHFHNNHPGQVLEYCAKFGSLHDIIIDNMRDQHHDTVAAAAAPAEAEVRRPCGVIAVCAGEGMAALYRELGASVISGGQTMNPSAEDLLNAVNACPAEQVVILPNNSNIILTADQVKTLSDKPVQVVRSKYVTQGLTAMLGFDPDGSAADNAESMAACTEQMVNGELTYAVRDTAFNGFDIKANDLLALEQGQITGCGSELRQVLLELADKMCADCADPTLITLYYGNGLTADQAQELADAVAEAHPDQELELHEGGQPLYYFLLSVE